MRSRIWKLLAAGLAALAVAGGAAAYWLTGGNGSGSATAASALAIAIAPGTPTAALYPGGSGDVATVVSNPNGFHVYLDKLELDTAQGTGGFSVDAGHSGCSVSALGFTTQTVQQFVPAHVGATDGSLTLDLTGSVSLGSSAANACQGATFTVYLRAA